MLSNIISIDELFAKKYLLKFNHTNTPMPNADLLFITKPWYDDGFQAHKNSLNLQKSQLNNYDVLEWRNHTLRTNPARNVLKTVSYTIKPELLTIAWMKFYECACSFDIISEDAKLTWEFNSVHLCEAPGAFITALNHFLKLQYKHLKWKWLANTLNPYYEGNSMMSTVCDDRFIKHTLDHWNFGSDHTGNLMDWNNAEYIINQAKSIGKIHLVTADGSIDCSLNPDEQESVVASLHYCEAITALQMLDEGGTFIIKIFTTYEHYTINLIYLLASQFASINFFKPVTSKPGNSEVYLICLKYVGYYKIEPIVHKLKEVFGSDNFSAKAMFPRYFLPEQFIEDLFHASYTYYYYQFYTIYENVYILQNSESDTRMFSKLTEIQRNILKRYMSDFDLRPISENETIVSSAKYNKGKNKLCRNIFQTGNYYERISFSKTTFGERASKIKDTISEYENKYSSLKTTIKSKMLKKHDFIFTYGKPLKKIITSSFIDSHILKMYDELKSTINSVGYLSKLPRREKTSNNHIIYFELFNFEDYYDGWEKFSIFTILRVLNEMNLSENLVLNNFDLPLSQFSVGFLYLLISYGFDKITFQENNVSLLNLKDKIGLSAKLKILDDALKTNKDKALLTIFPIEVLFEGEYFWALVNYNSSRLYTYLVKNVI